jgi:hypothetical protein
VESSKDSSVNGLDDNGVGDLIFGGGAGDESGSSAGWLLMLLLSSSESLKQMSSAGSVALRLSPPPDEFDREAGDGD